MLGLGLAYGLGASPACALAALALAGLGPLLSGSRRLTALELGALGLATAAGTILVGLVLLPAVELARRMPRLARLPALMLAGACSAVLLSLTAAWLAMTVGLGLLRPDEALAAMDAHVLSWWRENPGEGMVDLAVGLSLFTGCGAELLEPGSRLRRLGLALLGGVVAWGFLAMGDASCERGRVLLIPEELWRQPGALLLLPLCAALGLELGPRVDAALRALWERWVHA